ncbi:MAG TPA: hypothetical protein VEZ48_01780 [Sphingomonadaceae bacterium]|nr:hypothetical protein [Sphingomonadaceae bacterium]
MTETLARGSDGKPRVRKAKRDGWTGVKARTFLDHLRISCNVAASCRKAGVGETAVYNRRKIDAAFRAEWGAALSEAVDRLEILLLERAIKGTRVERRARDGAVVRTVQYPDRVALALLAMNKGKAEAYDAPDDEAELAALRIKIGRKLDAVAKRERKAARDAEHLARGLADEAGGGEGAASGDGASGDEASGGAA